MNPRTLKILLKKEVSLIKRNPIIPRLIVGMPVLVMLIIPLVTTLDVKNVGVVVVDNDRTELSRRLIADMNASEYLSVTGCFFTYDEAFQQIENGEADALVAIPENYLNDLTNGHKPTLALKANGVNAVIYGHLHGSSVRADRLVKKNGIPYYLTSCDMVDNRLVEIKF